MLSHTLILEIGIAVGLVAIVGLIANKLKFSVIPFFIIIGMVLGQHAPQVGLVDLTFTESKPFIDFMGRLGVLFLLFYLGLEFSVN
ncbi:MAG: cation:proton antiporter, partial [Sphingobacterium siyangense]